MTTAVVETVHTSGWSAVAGSIDSLHAHTLRSAADDVGGVRLAVLNMVAACIDRPGFELATRVVTALGAHHPARAIVIKADPESDAMVEADVSLQRTAVGDYEVYTELIQLLVGGEPAFHLTSLITPLLIPDIPVDLWVVGAPRLAQAFSEDAVELCDRIIIDSGAYTDSRSTLQLIAAQLNRHDLALRLADIAWERTRVWRELTAQGFDPPAAHPLLWHITDVDLRSAGSVPSSQAWLMAGWMASRLNWMDGRQPRISAMPAPATGVVDGDLVYARFRARAGERHAAFALARDHDALHTAFEVDGTTVERTLPYNEPDVQELISRLMDEAREETIYPAAVLRAAALAQ